MLQHPSQTYQGATRPGSIELIAFRSAASLWDNWSVQHTLPNWCSPLDKMSLASTSPSLAVSASNFTIASARLDGMKYVLLLRRPCRLASKSLRDRLALGAVRAIPPGVCWASPVQSMSGCCLSRLIVAISRSDPYCWPSSMIINASVIFSGSQKTHFPVLVQAGSPIFARQ